MSRITCLKWSWSTTLPSPAAVPSLCLRLRCVVGHKTSWPGSCSSSIKGNGRMRLLSTRATSGMRVFRNSSPSPTLAGTHIWKRLPFVIIVSSLRVKKRVVTNANLNMGGKLVQFSAFRDKAGKLSCGTLELRGHEMRPLASQTVGKFYCAFDCGICFVN